MVWAASHGGGVDVCEARFGEGGLTRADGVVVAVEVGEALEKLRTAAMAVHVAEAADVHEDVEAEALPGGEGAEELVVGAAVLHPEADDLGALGLGEGADGAAELAIGEVAMRVEEAGGELDFEGFVVLEEVDDGGRVDRLVAHELVSSLREVGAACAEIGRGDSVFDEGGGSADGPGVGVGVPGGRGGGVAELVAEGADLGEVTGEEAGDLGFEGAGIDDLPEGGIGGEGEEVAGGIEGSCLEGALVGFGLHGLGAGDRMLQGFEHTGADAVVGGEGLLDGLGVEGRGGFRRGRGEPAGAAEVLVASGALLTVPALLVDQGNGGEEAQRRSMAKGMWARSAMERWPYWK